MLVVYRSVLLYGFIAEYLRQIAEALYQLEMQIMFIWFCMMNNNKINWIKLQGHPLTSQYIRSPIIK